MAVSTQNNQTTATFNNTVTCNNGLILSTGDGRARLEIPGILHITMSGDNLSSKNCSDFSGHIENVTVALQSPTTKQTSAPDATAYELNQRAVQIGDVLGKDYKLPESLKRLDGWMIYNITDAGMPQALEADKTAPKKHVTWTDAKVHAGVLQGQGHRAAHLWTAEDSEAIFQNLDNGTLPIKENFHAEHGYVFFGAASEDRHWGKDRSTPLRAKMYYPANNVHRSAPIRGENAYARALQDVPELIPPSTPNNP